MDNSIRHEDYSGASSDQRKLVVPTQSRSANGQSVTARNQIQQIDKAASLTRQLLQLLGIRRVVDVDDSWHDGIEPDKDLVFAAISTGMLLQADLIVMDSLRPLATNADGDLLVLEDFVDNLQDGWDNLPLAVKQELTDAAKVIADADQAEPTPDGNSDSGGSDTAHLTASQADNKINSAPAEDVTDAGTLLRLSELIGREEISFMPLTLRAWRERQDDILTDPTPTLILFDQDFTREGGAENEGERMLAVLLNRKDLDHVAFGLLTHRAVRPIDEVHMASEISARHSVDDGRVIVIGKTRITEEPSSLASALRVAMVARELRVLRDHAATALEKAHSVALDSLRELEAWTSMAMLAAARHEGAHEPEGLIRLAQNAHRRGLEKALRIDEIVEGPLPKLRQALDIELGPLGMPKPSKLWALQRQERFDDGPHLAALHLPLDTGDIFRIEDPSKLAAGNISKAASTKHCILLVQPCDAAVRSDGKRSYNPKAFVVAWMKKYSASQTASKNNEVLLEAFGEEDGSNWLVQLASRTFLPVRALDASVLSDDGLAKIVVGESMPRNLTPPWQKKHQELQTWAAKVITKLAEVKSQNSSLAPDVWGHLVNSLTGSTSELHDLKSVVVLESKTIYFGIRRVGRLTDPSSRALLTLASQHQARPALDGPLFADIDEQGY